MTRYRFRGRGLTDMVILADIAAPSVVVGASLLGFYVNLKIPRGLLDDPDRARRLQHRLRRRDPQGPHQGPQRVARGGREGSRREPWTAFWRVTFPLIFPGIIAAALLGFALSIDDYIITSFVAGQTLTFPLWVYGAVKVGIPPQVFVMGTLIFAAGVALAVASVILQRRGRVARA